MWKKIKRGGRIYNDKDYIRLLESVGFSVEVRNLYKDFGMYGLNEKEDLYICKKAVYGTK